MKIFIVEDDIINIEIAKAAIEQCGCTVCGFAYNYAEAIQKIDKLNPDIVLVDITLPGEKDIGEWLHTEKKIPHIYLTSHKEDEKIKDAVKTGPINYLIKPLQKDSLKTSIELLKANLLRYKNNTENLEDFIFIKTNNRNTKYYINEILYAYSDETPNFCAIVLEKEKCIKIRSSLRALCKKYQNVFTQVHQTFIVNPMHIKSTKNNFLYLKNGEKLPIGRKYKKDILSILSDEQ